MFASVPTFTLWDATKCLRNSLRVDETREFIECYDDKVLPRTLATLSPPLSGRNRAPARTPQLGTAPCCSGIRS